VISFGGGEWIRFISTAVEPTDRQRRRRDRADDDGGAAVRSRRDGVELRFTEGEWRAFVSGIHAGEFDFHRATGEHRR
jgi:hypothetical protein